MKFFAIFISAFFLAIVLGIFIFAGMAGFIINATQAEEYSPLDFVSDYNKFEVTVGFDRINGRYATYHYEFAD